jgi:nucleoid-associated protein YgaU
MPKNVMRSLSVILGVLFLCGCTATKDVEVRHYVEVKDRVDQNMDEGNAGFVMGTPQPEDRSEIRKTRKTYVLEVSKNIEQETEEVVAESGEAFMEEPVYEDEGMGYEDEDIVDGEDFTDVSYEEEDEEIAAEPSFVEYTIQKDDTLQKISKKFYDSYSKWPKIYEVNKAVIKDPDRIKPGTVIQIPTE